MLKQGSFINYKYGRLLVFGLLAIGACILENLLDGIVGGSQLGETALSAIVIVSPLIVITACISDLFSGGYAVIYGNYAGAFDKKNAYRTAGEAVLVSLMLGVLWAFVLFLIKEPFLAAFQCTGEIYTYASAYYQWIIVMAAMYPILFCLYYLLLIDGDAFMAMVSTGAQILINIVFSFMLCHSYGVSGLGMATVISYVVGFVIYLSHFFRKTNSVHFTFSWSFQRMAAAFRLSLGSSLRKLFVFAENIILNAVVISTCGTKMLPAYVVINFILNCFIIGSAVYESGSGFFAAFVGEKNNFSIRRLYRICKKHLLFIGIALNVFFVLGAVLLPKLYQISTPAVSQVSIISSVILAFSAVPYCVLSFICNVYPTLGKPFFSSFLSFLLMFFCPLLFSVPFAFIFGYIGIPIGLTLGSFLAFLLFVVIARKKYGKEDFPLYLKEDRQEAVSFDLRVSLQTIPELRDRVVDAARSRGVDILGLGLLVEELYTRILEKNPGKTVISECTLLFGPDAFRLIVRDSGRIFNYTNEDNAVDSLNAHVLNCLLTQVGMKHHSVTTSYNRNCFVYSNRRSQRRGKGDGEKGTVLFSTGAGR